jgi:hypothetical protein
MGKYQTRITKKEEPSRNSRQIHPIWRGVGFVFMVLIPIMSYAIARLFLDENMAKGWVTFPQNFYLRGTPLPEDIFILIIIVVVLMIILYALLTFFSLIVFRLFAPPRYGPLDVPPISYHGKPYKR